ncbi:asparagine synthase-related protein [Actinomadura gamaensis]|uniref:asparagine synthase (glutamine-hydrolyzing) n=1 Tax=Actinomadura gamaensis TaxID=1763541 RepID=A0ABV9UAL1_9ACTN
MVRAGAAALAVAGVCSSRPPELAAGLAGVRRAGDVESLVEGAAGSFTVLASLDGEVYGRGPAFGTRRLYHARLGGVTVAADRARTLAWLTGAQVDLTALAARLPAEMPYLLGERALWQDVHTVTPGQALHLDRQGKERVRSWWRAPREQLPLAEAAPALREALGAAVAARVRPGQVWAADVSGGMDSTSLAFLAAEAGARLVTVTLRWAAPGNEDHRYAAQAVARLGGIAHVALDGSERESRYYATLQLRDEPHDDPMLPLRDRAQQEHITRLLAEHTVTARLSGLGGDHVVSPPPWYLHALIRRHPLIGLRHVAGQRAGWRWPWPATVRAMAERGGYADWLNGQADRVGGSGAAATGRRAHQGGTVMAPPHGWGPPVRLPGWAGTEARERLAEALRATARHGEPLADERGRHAWMERARAAGRIAAAAAWPLYGSAGSAGGSGDASGSGYAGDNPGGSGYAGDDPGGSGGAAGLPLHMPFCDDAVIEACLAARPHEVVSGWAYKPLLTTAMRGVLPESILARTSKDHANVEWQAGMRAHQGELAAWAENSHLVAVGLAEPAALRRALVSPDLYGGGAADLENTLIAEAWLRDLAAHPAPAHLHRHDRPEPDLGHDQPDNYDDFEEQPL